MHLYIDNHLHHPTGMVVGLDYSNPYLSTGLGRPSEPHRDSSALGADLSMPG